MPYQYKRELLSDDEVNPVRNSSGALNPAAEQRGIISNGVNPKAFIFSPLTTYLSTHTFVGLF
jgi:hypothetical protein